MSSDFEYFGETSLVSRLTRGLRRRPQGVIFLVGSPFSAPAVANQAGVPGVTGIIEMIREEFQYDPPELSELDAKINSDTARGYQTAFQFVQGTRGQTVANEIIRKAVLRARALDGHLAPPSDEACRLIESELDGWTISPSMSALASLATYYPKTFGEAILTTNFDPLIEVAIRQVKGLHYRTTLHADGYLYQTEGDGCHVIHLHGYWHNSDTLNTTRQLLQSRPRLKASLTSLLKDRLVVVCGYGGWNDVFTNTLLDLVRDDSAGPEVLWTFHSDTPVINDTLIEQLAPGLDRGRISLYSGVDCNSLLPRLLSAWRAESAPENVPVIVRSNPVVVRPTLRQQIDERISDRRMLQGDDEDRPPLVDLCLGRERELDELKHSKARVAFVTGIGGQGKSTLAAKYFVECQSERRYDYFIWRDCKEEGERFESQIASMLETMSGGVLSTSRLAKLDIQTLVDILKEKLDSLSVLFVFDNVDHYVDLEKGLLTTGADSFVRAVLDSDTRSRVVFTCRPTVDYRNRDALSLKLQGLTPEAAEDLFRARGADSSPFEVADAHRVTNGHAFWLDLLALQVTNTSAPTDLQSLLKEMNAREGAMPAVTLQSIWARLSDRERSVLRAMGVTVRPETERELGEYLKNEMNFNKFLKTLKNLRALNLIVVKQASDGATLLELHPLVRQFVRNNFSHRERVSIIDTIISVYQRFMGLHKDQLRTGPSLSILQHWTQAAELDIEAGRIGDAIVTLAEASGAFESSAFTREYVRAVRVLLASFDWPNDGRLYSKFDLTFRLHVHTLAYLGEYSEVERLLDKYGASLVERDARYIRYCEMRCYSKWLQRDYEAAIEWGSSGQNLKNASDVDAESNITHSLALAERDGGQPEVALRIFLEGRPLAEVVDPEELDENRRGAHYGNVGRCLQLMGRINDALVCFQKSALLVEKRPEEEHAMNQGFIRSWIGELLIARGERRLGSIFLRAASEKWREIAPPLAKRVINLHEQYGEQLSDEDSAQAESVYHDWIMGTYLDVAI